MPASEMSLRITDRYRAKLAALAAASAQTVRGLWHILDLRDLDATRAEWAARTARPLETLQGAGVRLSSAYLTAFIASETHQAAPPPEIQIDRYVGVAQSGLSLAEVLDPAVITIKQAIAGGESDHALEQGLNHALRVGSSETTAPARAALADTIKADERIIGWRRVTAGGCGACLAAATRVYGDSEPLRVHPHCECVSQPIIRGVRETVQHPDGHEIFASLTPQQQDDLLGEDKAQLIRLGKVRLTDLASLSPMDRIEDVLTERPLKAL